MELAVIAVLALALVALFVKYSARVKDIMELTFKVAELNVTNQALTRELETLRLRLGGDTRDETPVKP